MQSRTWAWLVRKFHALVSPALTVFLSGNRLLDIYF